MKLKILLEEQEEGGYTVLVPALLDAFQKEIP